LSRKKFVNLLENDKAWARKCTAVHEDTLYKAVEMRVQRHGKKQKQEISLVNLKKQLPHVFIFIPHLLIVATKIRGSHQFKVRCIVRLAHDHIVKPVGPDLLHLYCTTRYFEFQATSSANRDILVRKIKDCIEQDPKKLKAGPVATDEFTIHGISIKENSNGTYEVLGFVFDENANTENFKFDANTSELLLCSFEKFFERLTAPNSTSSNPNDVDMRNFFICSPVILPSLNMLQLFIARLCVTKYANSKDFKSLGIKQRIAQLVFYWFSTYPDDFLGIEELEALANFAKIIKDFDKIGNTSEELERLLVEKIDKFVQENESSVEPSPRDNKLFRSSRKLVLVKEAQPLAKNITLRDFAAKSVAEQLTAQAQSLLSKVTARDLFMYNNPSNALRDVFEDHHQLSKAVENWLESQPSDNERIHMLAHLLDVSSNLLYLNNFHHAFALYEGLVARCEVHFADLNRLSEYSLIKWNSLHGVMYGTNHSNYFEARKRAGNNVLPSLYLEAQNVVNHVWITSTPNQELLRDRSFILLKPLYDLCQELTDLVQPYAKPYIFEPVSGLWEYLQQQFLAEILPHTNPTLNQIQKKEESLCILDELKLGIFEKWLQGDNSGEFESKLGFLLGTDLKSLIKVHQWKLHYELGTMVRTEILNMPRNESRASTGTDLLVQISNCEQFSLLEYQIVIHNSSNSPVKFKWTIPQKTSYASVLKLHPWRGEIPPQENFQILCSVIIQEDQPPRMAARLELENSLGFALVVDANPIPFSKITEYDQIPAVQRILGKGGSGQVFVVNLAGEGEPEKLAAAKSFHGLHEMEDRQLDEFRREVKFLSTIEHNHVVRVLGFCRNPPCIFTEYLPAGDLAMAISSSDWEFSPNDCKTLALGIASAMKYLHSLEYFHRDLKPANILVHKDPDTGQLCPKLCDFGGITCGFSATVTRNAMGLVFFFTRLL